MNTVEIDNARAAVADSMMVAQARFVEYLQCRKTKPTETLPEILARRSKLACLEGSASVIHDLATKHSGSFDRLMIMTSRIDEGFTFKANPDWGGHAYFLARSTAGEWFAGSPANYLMTPDSQHMTRIIRGAVLDNVLSSIQGVDGGIWPTAEFIAQSADAHYQAPVPGLGDIGYPLVETFVVKREEGEMSHAYEAVSLKGGKNWMEELLGQNMFAPRRRIPWSEKLG